MKDLSLEEYRIDAKRAAKELKYPPEIIRRVMTATTISEICRAMITARHATRSALWR